MIRTITFIFVTCLLFSVSSAVVDSQVCKTNFTTNATEAFAQIYDNQTKGDVVFKYLDIFNQFLHFPVPCKGIRLNGSFVILDMTNEELKKDCDLPKGACDIMCGTYKGSLHRIRHTLPLAGPQFKRSTYYLNITENSLNGSVIFSFAKDDFIRNDCYSPDDKTFDLQHIQGRRAFGVTYPGKIFLTRQLDYENGDVKFVLNVTLKNVDRYAMTTVVVNVIDVDDMDPEFDRDDYYLSVAENQDLSTKWQKTNPEISAHDRDKGTGKQDILYALYNSSNNDIIDINDNTGEIKIKKVLDREVHSYYIFKIKVYQRNDHRRSATSDLHIIVTDQNDNGPIFEKSEYQTSVDEHSSNGTFILQVHATDKDAAGFSNVKYSIVGNQDQFQIDSRTGVISVANQVSLDAENLTNPLLLKIRATDADNMTFYNDAMVKVTVNDKNDNSPIFTQNVYHFNARSSGNIGQIKANDLDKNENGEIAYSLESAPAGVHIDKDTGSISTNTPMSSGAVFRVKACDSPSRLTDRRCSFANVVITTAPIKPTKVNLIESVTENVPVGSIVTVVQAVGAQYDIIENNVPFSINLRGVITTSEVFDYENGPKQYNFRVEVLSNAKSVIANIQVTVNIEDVNDNYPVFQNSSYTFVYPDEPENEIGKVKATDEDSGINGNVTYALHNTRDSIGFTCDERSGVIRGSDRVDKTKRTYQLYITAVDAGKPKLSTYTEVLVIRNQEMETKVKFGTPLDAKEVCDRKDEFKGRIDRTMDIETTIKECMAVENQLPTRSFMLISGNFHNGSGVPANNLRILLLEHMAEIQELFSSNKTLNISTGKSTGMGIPEIALIVISGVIFIGSIILIIVIRTQWTRYKRQFKFDRLNNHLTRRSSLYESQEIKVKMDDETSDYAGSLNTQEIENNQSTKCSSLEATAFSNPVYQTVHGQTLVISPSTAAATNEALESLQDLAERLNIEETNPISEVDKSEETFVKEAEGTRIITSVETYEDVDFDQIPENMNHDNHLVETDADSTNLMQFESEQSLDKNENGDDDETVTEQTTDGEYRLSGNDSVFEGQNMDIESEPETSEPDVDYNDKQVRFSSIVLDTEDDVFKPLKEETITPAQFQYDSEYDDRDIESLASSFPDLYKLVKHDPSETDRADEEINSPIDFFTAETLKRSPTDHGTFHFSITEANDDEITKF